jgi:hypothetical protein
MTVEVEMIADSVAAETGVRCSTLVLRYPRAIHAEFMTHKVFGRNASSSRAIPMKKMHASIVEDPAYPEKWTLNEPGMQGYKEADEDTIAKAKTLIAEHRRFSIMVAEGLADIGLHKQIFNRYTEAHQHIRVVVTATQWANFLALRTHETAEPTIQEVARQVKDCMDSSQPVKLQRGDWHLPYFDEEEFEDSLIWREADDKLHNLIPFGLHNAFPPHSGKRALYRIASIAISAARCARVSYNNFEGRRSEIEEDIGLFDKLVGSRPVHASPTEHQGTPDWRIRGQGWANSSLHGNLTGFKQARKFLPLEAVKDAYLNH